MKTLITIILIVGFASFVTYATVQTKEQNLLTTPIVESPAPIETELTLPTPIPTPKINQEKYSDEEEYEGDDIEDD